MTRLLILSLSLLSLLIPSENRPQNDRFEGSIKFEISYIKLPPEAQGMESMLPSVMSMKFKGELLRIDQEVMGGSQTIITNNTAKEAHLLMDMMGQKLDIFMDKATLEAEEANIPKPNITVVEEYKNVLDYKCQKAIIEQAGMETEVWFTDKINAIHKDYEELPGFPLEYVTNQQGMKLRITASEVSQSKVADSAFEVPAGYKSMTMQELQQMMGGY